MIIKQYNKGFTLVEVIVAVALLAIIVAGTTGMVKFYQKSYNSIQEDNSALENANIAMQAIVSEIRQANSVTDVSNGTSVTFTDLNNNTIQYSLDNTNHLLTRTFTSGVSSTTETVADNIADVRFTYPDAGISSTVSIRIVVNVNNGYTVELQDSIRPRNM